MPITHEQQKERWNKEHKNPYALVQMDQSEPSSSVELFLEFLEKQKSLSLLGIEMGCGKGRNVIAAAKQKFVSKMYGFDFSEVAIIEANKRGVSSGVAERIQLMCMDATEPWVYPSDFFDFAIDCAASTDIESATGRQFAIDEMYRVLKPGGYFLVYVMSTEDEYHRLMQTESPAEEANAFYHVKTGKFEKFFSEEELDMLHKKFILIEKRNVNKISRFFGVPYGCNLHWRIYQKPLQ